MRVIARCEFVAVRECNGFDIAVFKGICAQGAAEGPLDRDAAKVARDWRGIADDRTRNVMRDVTRALSKAGSA